MSSPLVTSVNPKTRRLSAEAHEWTPEPSSHAIAHGTPNSQFRDVNSVIKLLLRQIEFYFSNQNLWKDPILLNEMAKDASQYVSVAMLAGYGKIPTITNDIALIICALKQSSKLQLNESHTAVRRIHPLPQYDQYKDANRTIYVHSLPPHSTVKSVKKLFARFGKVTYVLKPEQLQHIMQHKHTAHGSSQPSTPLIGATSTPIFAPLDSEDPNNHTLTTAFVQFEKPAFAKKALTAINLFQQQRNGGVSNSGKSLGSPLHTASTPSTPILSAINKTPLLQSKKSISSTGTSLLSPPSAVSSSPSPPGVPSPKLTATGSPSLRAKQTLSPTAAFPPPLSLNHADDAEGDHNSEPEEDMHHDHDEGEEHADDHHADTDSNLETLPDVFLHVTVMPKLAYLKQRKSISRNATPQHSPLRTPSFSPSFSPISIGMTGPKLSSSSSYSRPPSSRVTVLTPILTGAASPQLSGAHIQKPNSPPALLPSMHVPPAALPSAVTPSIAAAASTLLNAAAREFVPSPVPRQSHMSILSDLSSTNMAYPPAHFGVPATVMSSMAPMTTGYINNEYGTMVPIAATAQAALLNFIPQGMPMPVDMGAEMSAGDATGAGSGKKKKKNKNKSKKEGENGSSGNSNAPSPVPADPAASAVPAKDRFSLTKRGSAVTNAVVSRFALGPQDENKGFAGRGRGKPIAV